MAINKSLILSSNEYKTFNGTSWQTVSSTLPTSTQFLGQGMDELTPLLDRAVTELEPIGMDDNSINGEVLGSGRMFKEKIDLNKYFDIRSIKVESQ